MGHLKFDHIKQLIALTRNIANTTLTSDYIKRF